MEALRDLRAKRVSVRLLALTISCAVAAALAPAALGIGAGAAAPAASFDATRDAVVLGPADLERIGARAAGAVTSDRSARLSYFTTVNFETAVPGGGELYEIRCPEKRQPVTGGVFAASPGLAVTNSSRTSPDPDRPTLSGAWYEGVTNLTAGSLQWKPVLVCIRS